VKIEDPLEQHLSIMETQVECLLNTYSCPESVKGLMMMSTSSSGFCLKYFSDERLFRDTAATNMSRRGMQRYLIIFPEMPKV
jgi:hypothetical protein